MNLNVQQLNLTCLTRCFSKLQFVLWCILSRISQNITLSLPISPSSSPALGCPYSRPVSVPQHFHHLAEPGREGGCHKDWGDSKAWPSCWKGPGLPERMSSCNHVGTPSCEGKVTVPGKVNQGRMMCPSAISIPFYFFF